MTSPALHGPLAAIAALPQPDLKTIFTAEPDRLSSLVLSQGPLRFDWSKTHLTGELIDAFLTLAQEQGFAAQRDALFAGEAVNNTEGRAAEHPAERGEGKADSVARAKALHARMRALIDAIEDVGIDPCDVAPDHWHHVHNRLAGGMQVRFYSPARHRDWLRRRKLQS